MKTDDFTIRVYTLLHAIPAGRVTSYGGLAAMAGHAGRARMVGAILRRLPPGSHLPWHRVVTASGKPAFPAGSDAFNQQKGLLEAEGVVFAGARVNLKVFGWQP
ncbi:MGMT family protein [Simiduia aestuariiviva]|uniref:Methylated-DNA-protein-cysteine methyltransferase-like protein n=1 Tax=Simiduia aestuariiviva TaxID=1510459 RepID=A0A839UQR1_9GAMM|nr:MGMT family protein [Simiduia aestuariiviva]MBB3169071.1 methylated-DNA-protein-cysteine methyltransferase-like protein [Simiduia aestuariiviva]